MFLWLRRVYQVVFLGLFLFLVVVTTAGWIRGYPVKWFLEIDPLVALSTALSTRSLYHHLLWSLPLVILTLVFGRFFCGWMCPMGVLHHLLGWLGRPRRKPDRVQQNHAGDGRAGERADRATRSHRLHLARALDLHNSGIK
jgi:polyferredoxin